jgi:hypothetical protein
MGFSDGGQGKDEGQELRTRGATLPLVEAIELFRQVATARALPAARVRAVLSYVRSTADGARAVRGLPIDNDVMPVLAGMRDLAAQVGRTKGERGSAVRSRTSNVALFARLVCEAAGLGADESWVAGLPEGWHPLVERVRDLTARQALRDLIQLAAERGCALPSALPPAVTMVAWGDSDPRLAALVRRGLAAYQIARRRAAGAPARAPLRSTEYGIQALHFLPALIAAAERRQSVAVTAVAELKFEEMPRARELIERLAPLMGRALVAFEVRRLAAHASADYLQSAERAVSRCIASVARLLVRDGATMDEVAAEVAGLSLVHLWTIRRTVSDTDEGPGLLQLADPGDPDLEGLVPDNRSQTAPLLRAVADEMSAHSYRASPLKVSVQAAELAVPLYTPAVVQAVRRLYAVARDALRPKLISAGEAGIARWQTIEFEQRAMLVHMTALSRRRRATGQVDKRLLPFHWGELVCVGLPALRQRAMAAEARWAEWQVTGGAANSARGLREQAAWHRALTSYVVTAVFSAEGMREKNLRGAQLGAQVRPEWSRDRQGRVVGVERVITQFRGDDPSWVRLKQTHDSGGGLSPRARVREWQWAPGLVDHRLLYRYLSEVRPKMAVRAGLLAEGSAYDVDRDQWALFISSRPCSGRSGGRAHGGFSPGILSDLVGRNLFWIVRDVLKRQGIPSTYREACRNGNPMRGLFGAHVIRSLAATWWGGLRNRWDYAEAYTNDLQPTLHAHYSKIPSWMARAVGTGGPSDPTWWGELVDVMVSEMDSTLDWDGFWREFDPAREWQAEQVRRRLRRCATPDAGAVRPEGTGGPSRRAG